jgi:sucrose-phosphate synthase
MSKAEIEDSYKISRRIEGEERGLDYATMVFTSTQQEVGLPASHSGDA